MSSETNGAEPTPDADAPEPTVAALVERIDALERENAILNSRLDASISLSEAADAAIFGETIPEKVDGALVDRLRAVEERLARIEELADPDGLEWERMDRSEKVRRVRQHLVNRAKKRDGKASLDYREVIALFDGHPSDGTAYSLMEAAGTKDGFDCGTRHGGNKRVTVDLGRLKDQRGVSGGEE